MPFHIDPTLCLSLFVLTLCLTCQAEAAPPVQFELVAERDSCRPTRNAGAVAKLDQTSIRIRQSDAGERFDHESRNRGTAGLFPWSVY